MAKAKTSTPAKMINDAFDLFEVAVAASVRRFEEKELVPSSTTSVFLLGSAIELALLSYLTYKGFANEALASINHDLEVALEQANGLGLKQITELGDDFLGSVRRLNADFKYQNIVQASMDHSQLPILLTLQRGTQNLLAIIAEEVGQSDMLAA